LNLSNTQLSRFSQSYNSLGNPVTFKQQTNFLDGTPLLSTAQDMLIFLRANLGDPTTNVSPELLNAFNIAHEVHFQIGPNELQRLAWTSIVLNNATFIHKNGFIFGFKSYVVFIPERNMTGVILVNKDADPPGPVLRSILLGFMAL
jgi:beta-lactamase class C